MAIPKVTSHVDEILERENNIEADKGIVGWVSRSMEIRFSESENIARVGSTILA